MNSVPNHSETSVAICIKCGAGAPTERNDKVKMVCFKVCAACEQKSGDAASRGVAKRRGKRDKDTTRQKNVNDITEDFNSVAALDDTSMCAACGKSGEDINLKWCNACKMVKYCNRDCQIAHRPKHKKECRQRALEIQNGVDDIADNLKKVSISDDKLFQEPPAKEDCAICMLPVPYTGGLCGVQVTYQPCCGKLVCTGCTHASGWAMVKGDMKKNCCIFCRAKDLSEEEEMRRCKERMKAGHAETFDYVADVMFHERGDVSKALELWSRGANLGNASSHHSIADVYLHGKGVEKDDKKAQYHLERAAIGGHEMARHSLGINEYNDGNMNRAMKHFMMAARTGYDEALKQVENGYKWGIVEKDEYESTLRAHKVSQEEMKSNQRIFAERIEQARIAGIGPHDEGMKDVMRKLIAEGLVNRNGIVP